MLDAQTPMSCACSSEDCRANGCSIRRSQEQRRSLSGWRPMEEGPEADPRFAQIYPAQASASRVTRVSPNLSGPRSGEALFYSDQSSGLASRAPASSSGTCVVDKGKV